MSNSSIDNNKSKGREFFHTILLLLLLCGCHNPQCIILSEIQCCQFGTRVQCILIAGVASAWFVDVKIASQKTEILIPIHHSIYQVANHLERVLSCWTDNDGSTKLTVVLLLKELT